MAQTRIRVAQVPGGFGVEAHVASAVWMPLPGLEGPMPQQQAVLAAFAWTDENGGEVTGANMPSIGPAQPLRWILMGD